MNHIVALMRDGIAGWLHVDTGRFVPRLAGGAPTIEELESRQAEIKARFAEIDQEHAGRSMPEEARSEWNRLGEERKQNETLLDELRTRMDFLRSISDESGTGLVNREGGAGFNAPTRRADADIWDIAEIRRISSGPEDELRMLRDNALTAVEQAHFPHPDANREACQEHIERLMDQFAGDERSQAEFARRILQTGSPIYKRAFGKALAGNPMSSEEQRALALTGASGGYAVPYTLDPTVILTSNGAVNPLRSMSRVEQITGNEWRGVTSAGVTASYDAELAEVSDDTPSLGQPTANVEKAQAFVPFSIEAGQDWSALQSELAKMMQDAKDRLEADKFVTGAGHGSNEPQGLLVGATGTVAAGTASFAIANLYALEEALDARWQTNASFLSHRGVYNRVRQFDTAGGSALWLRIGQGINNGDARTGNTGAELLGYPAYQSSAYTNALTAGTKILTFGDFDQFLIVDRIGMNVEIIPHLMGASRRPIGSRGMYAYWRNTSAVLVPGAFKTLVTT
jgi:HK97 family phage major capsid protein